APAPAPVDPDRTYRIASGNGRALAQAGSGSATSSVPAVSHARWAAWSIVADGDGSYRIVNADTGRALGVDSSSTGSRAWATRPTVTPLGSHGPTVGQQWFIVRNASHPGTYRLVNRYSGLVLGLSGHHDRRAETTPLRTWTNHTGDTVGGGRTAAEQTLTFVPTGHGHHGAARATSR
ncbi:MAG: RICIN domain-containing protein, partial [Actinocatenispora sp.]